MAVMDLWVVALMLDQLQERITVDFFTHQVVKVGLWKTSLGEHAHCQLMTKPWKLICRDFSVRLMVKE